VGKSTAALEKDGVEELVAENQSAHIPGNEAPAHQPRQDLGGTDRSAERRSF
jgi:hypothetical protein